MGISIKVSLALAYVLRGQGDETNVLESVYTNVYKAEMAVTRLNITLPEDVMKILKKHAGPRERSAFLAECVRAHVRKEKAKRLVEEMAEGYKTQALVAQQITAEFESADLESWDD